MSLALLTIDFPFSGPWGADLSDTCRDLADDIAREDGLIWKLWTEAPQSRRAGGVYLFADLRRAEHYRRKHLARLEAQGVRDVAVTTTLVNEDLSATTHGPLPSLARRPLSRS